MIETYGQKVVDISELLDIFVAQEGSVESFSGSVGEGKTYGATKRAISDLQKGRVVYTNWQLVLDEFHGDQRKDPFMVFFKTITGKKRFINIDLKQNWHYFDMEDEKTWFIDYEEEPNIWYGLIERKEKIEDKTRIYFKTCEDFIAYITDAVVYLDEGQDIFDSYEGTKLSKKKRKVITRTRHLRKTLVIISQRYQAIPPTARANVKTFYKHVKVMSWPFLRFKVYATTEIDVNHMPIFHLEEKSYESYWGSKKILNAYNSYYLSSGIPKSQKVHFEAYDLSLKQKLSLLGHLLFKIRLKPELEKQKLEGGSLGGESIFATIKKDLELPRRAVVVQYEDDQVFFDPIPVLRLNTADPRGESIPF